MRRTLIGFSALAAMAGQGAIAHMPAGHSGAHATLRDGAGIDVGTATVSVHRDMMRLNIAVHGMAPGTHGIHVHTAGKCDGPDFKTAGGHWNPGMKQHGRDNPMGAHSGDLPNIMVDAKGRGSLKADLPGMPDGLLDADGAAIVIHAAPDDYKTDPSGNSGSRVACGVFAAK